jgi:hypothetical protein
VNLPTPSELALLAATLKAGCDLRVGYRDEHWLELAMVWWEQARDRLIEQERLARAGGKPSSTG